MSNLSLIISTVVSGFRVMPRRGRLTEFIRDAFEAG